MARTYAVPMPSLIHGIFWMSGALVSFVSMAIAGRELSYTLDIFQILTFRSLIALLITILVIIRVG